MQRSNSYEEEYSERHFKVPKFKEVSPEWERQSRKKKDKPWRKKKKRK